MTTIKVDINLLRKYFSEHYDFDNNPGMYFREIEYDLEKDVYQKRYKPVYDEIVELCDRFKVLEHVDTFFNLYFISWIVKIRQNNVTPDIPENREAKSIISYKKELFELFQYIVKEDFKENFKLNTVLFKGEEKQFDYRGDLSDGSFNIKSREATRSLKINDEIFLDQFKTFIRDTVTRLFFDKKWYELSNGLEYESDPVSNEYRVKENELSAVLRQVNEWMDQYGKPKKGAPDKIYFIKPFVRDLKELIRQEIGDTCFQSDNQINIFLGKLLTIYGIYPKPTKKQLAEGDDHYRKIISNRSKTTA